MAVLAGGHILALLRDDKPGIPYPGLWDLPGGGREAGESPAACALRETWEEAGLRLSRADVTWRRIYPGTRPGQLPAWFLVAEPGWLCLPAPRLGAEGQAVRWMPLEAFLALGDAIGHLQDRLRDYLADWDRAIRGGAAPAGKAGA